MKELLPKFKMNAGMWSLRNQLALVFSSIALLLALTLVVVTKQVVRPYLEQNQGLFLAELAYQTAEKLDHGMFERYREIQIFATLNRFRSSDTDISSQRSLLDTIQATHTDYAWIGLIDQSGIVRASTQQILEGTDISQRPVFINAQGQPWVGDVHEAVLLAKFLPNPSNEPLRFVDVAVPVINDQGQQIGVLAAHLYWEWARRIEISLPNTFQNYSELETFIINQDHQIVLAPRSELKGTLTQDVILNATRQNGTGYLLETNQDDTSYLTAYAQTKGYQTYPGLGWTVLLRQPTTTAFRAARQLQQESLKLSLAFGFSLLCLGWVLARQIANPILKMAIATEQFRRGNRNISLPTLKGDSEVALLTQSFKKLLGELTDQERELIALNSSLEYRVEERTNELTRLNEALQLEATEHMETGRKLQELTVVLQHSNRELEQFAYVASHDLQEPLRAVASYTQMLERKYRGVLDEKAEKYIHYIVDGASRMQQLINDLLTYSRAEPRFRTDRLQSHCHASH
jgi:signal transduction histidine kinase